MKSVLKGLVLCGFSSLWLAQAAYADQCSYVTKPQAIAAFNNLELGQTIYEFCELCGDRTPQPVQVTSLAVSNTPGAGYWQVLVNNQNIDLAYTYIPYNDKHQKVNLALVANCPADGFTPLLSH